MSEARRVAVLKGGRSLERSVSLRSGAQVQDALQRLGHEVQAFDVGPELVEQLLASELDAAFIALHGRYGEDGTLQGLLDAIGLPYTGSSPAGCTRSTDKVLAKRLMREVGIPTPDFHPLREASIKELGAAAALGRIEADLGFPLVEGSDLVVFHAGTKRGPGGLLTSGGRVLGVTANGGNLVEARDRAYAGIARISWPGMHFRKDIGLRGKA